ncbi:MAG: uroporphyrinogen-III C-methyltransferase [Treponema sp.]|jgi:uroporphyrinogen III methyltransferase/synthase|nr:uroporphyrinogen-III C-methyltransferase [Treponema sp.]
MKEQGKVWLVGAGPGDAGLLTLKGRRILQNAELVLYDNLVGPGVLSLLPPAAETMYVGKSAGKHALSQHELNSLMVQKAREGKQVVRLKGGDPFLFGRGGEEAEELEKNNIPFEVVPGISAAIAVPEYFGIPLTHRDCCSQVHIVTAHGREDAAGLAINWKALVQAGGTLVIFMGLSSAETVCRSLMEAGLPPSTLTAVLEQGTSARQKKLVTTLEKLAAEAKERPFKPPALIVIGEVCGYSDKLSWYEKKPLAALRIGITRPRNRSGELFNLLSDAGAEVIQIPVIQTRIIPETPRLRETLQEMAVAGGAPHAAGKAGTGWFVFTSPAGVEIFFEKLKTYGIDIRKLRAARFAAIGKTTASELESRGILVDVIPEHFSGADLSGALLKELQPGDRAVLPRSSMGGAFIVDELTRAGITCLDIPIYDTITGIGPAVPLHWDHLIEGLDLCVFTSGSTVEGFASLFGAGTLQGLKAFCIGKETADAAARYRAKTFIAENAAMEAIVQGIIDAKNGGLL